MSNNNKITIHQAYYGEVKKSHSLLYSTIDNTELKSFLLQFTDRPGAIPMGMELKPYYSGTAFSGYYIFTKTFPDDSIRQGMVFTHALIIDLETVSNITSLNEIFTEFVSEIPQQKTIQVISRQFSESIFLSEKVPQFYKTTVEGLLSGSYPVVFSGPNETFAELLSTLWKGMFTETRKTFKYRISFTPHDIAGIEDLMIVNVPQETLSKWSEYPINLAEDSALVNIEDNAQKMLLGHKEHNEFHNFITSLKIPVEKLEVLVACNRAFGIYQNISNASSLEQIRQLARSITKLSPNPDDGVEIKSIVLSKLCELTLNGAAADIKALKNLTLSAFRDGEKELIQLIKKQLAAFFLSKAVSGHVPLIELITLAHNQGEEKSWWGLTIKKALKDILGSIDTVIAEKIWQIWNVDGKMIELLSGYISERAENTILEAIPGNTKKEIVPLIKKLNEQKKWYRLYAKILLTTKGIFDALDEQVIFEKDLSFEKSLGLRLLADSLADNDLIDTALKKQNDKLNRLVAERCVHKDALLNKMDAKEQQWIYIWAYAVQSSNNLKAGIKNIKKTVHDIYTALNKGLIIPDSLFDSISQSEFADISEHELRNCLWNKIDSKYHGRILSATAESIITTIGSGKSTIGEIEPLLFNKLIAADSINNFLKTNKQNISAVINLFNFFSNLKDIVLAEYIVYYIGSISEIDATSLGNIIKERNYSKSAVTIYNKAKNNLSFKISFSICRHLVTPPFWEYFTYGHLFNAAEVNSSDAYLALYELAKELYQQGPEENNIWKKSGGDVSKLTSHKTREENWRAAIHMLQHGGGGKNISTLSLLRQMKIDFANNNKIDTLLKYFKN